MPPVVTDPYLMGGGYSPTLDIAPRYEEGAEWGPAILGDVEGIKRLQAQLDQAGFYSGKYTVGVWDSVDADAYAELLGLANIQGLDETQMLQTYLANPRQKEEREKAERLPLQVILSNPDDIRTTANNIARELYGGNLPDGAIQAIIGQIHAQETAYDTTAYEQNTPGGPTAERTQAISAGAAAEKHIREEEPDQVARVQFKDTFDEMMQGMRSGPKHKGGVLG
jgi:hypothetical protein